MIWVEAAMAARSMRCSAGAAESVTRAPALPTPEHVQPRVHEEDVCVLSPSPRPNPSFFFSFWRLLRI